MKFSINMTYNLTDILDFETENTSGIKEVYVKWNNVEVVFNDGEELELTTGEIYPEELHDFKRPDYVLVSVDNLATPAYRSK